MEIRAGGRRWLVESRALKVGDETDAAASWTVSFRSPEADEDRVEMRWIPRPERLTESVAHRLFELAGERLWRDDRTGVIYRIHLVDEGRPGDDADPDEGRLLVQFRTGGTVGTVPYDLDHPLGLATEEELHRLADEVQPKLGGNVA